jgi:3-deoxy-D-manno-octulosonate 8-phosphate phosphatase (KDO 8-P phosphatase)
VKRVPLAVRKKAARIKLLLLDVDGVLTDGRIIINDRGVETKQFHVRDGQGISLLIRAGIDVGFITGRVSKVVRYRAQELGVRLIYQGVADKRATYAEIKRKTKRSDREIAYVGDDFIDLLVLRKVGLAISVSDGWPELFSVVDYVTEQKGGLGAVREVAELILNAQDKWPKLTERDSIC